MMIKENKDLEYTIHAEQLPKIKIKGIEEIKITDYEIKISDIDVDKKIINDSLDYFSSSMEIPIFELNDKKFQVFIIETTTEFDSNTMYASAYYDVTINEQSHSAATFLFDSFLTSPGDEVTAVWTFARLV